MASPTSPARRVLVSPEELIGYAIDGKYRLDSIIGGGGMGVVYRSTQQNLNRPVALKLLKLTEGNFDKSVERFKREIDIVAQLTHPNIVRVFDSGVDPELGLHYIAMELIEGVSLDRLIAQWRLKPQLSVEIARGICEALTEPHRLNIIHRDIKPGNILLTVRSDDTLGVKVVDFGISRSTQVEPDARVTSTGEVIGSPQYMAPEAARGVEIDARTDLYAVGVLLYEMISGQPLFQAPTPILLMLRHLREPAPSLHELNPGDLNLNEAIPAALSTLVDRLLAKSPDDRPASAREVLRELDAIRAAHNLYLPRLNSSASPIAALRPWMHRLSQDGAQREPGEPGATLGFLPFFEGWLVPDTADFLLQTPPPITPDFDDASQTYAWQHAQTLPLDTQDELDAPEDEKLADSAPTPALDTGRIAGEVKHENTEDFAVGPASVTRLPIGLMGAGIVALLITGAAIFWPRPQNPNPDAPTSVTADAHLSAGNEAPAIIPNPPLHQADASSAPPSALAKDPAGAEEAPQAELPAGTENSGAPADTAPPKAPDTQKKPDAKTTPKAKNSAAKSKKTPAPQQPREPQPSTDDAKLEEGLDWLKKR